MAASDIPDWVTYPGEDWATISPKEAGLDADALGQNLAGLEVREASFSGEDHSGNRWGSVITRGGYLLHSWGDRNFRFQTASTGKTFMWVLLGLAAKDGLLDPDQPVNRVWTGAGQLSHPHKHLDRGYHRTLTWRHLIGPKTESKHYGGFPMEMGVRWKERRTGRCRVGRLDRGPVLRPLLTRRARHRGPVQQRRFLAVGPGAHPRLGP